MKKFILTMAAIAVIVLSAVVVKNEYGNVLYSETHGMQPAILIEEIDHLFIGSSMFRLGIDIDVLEQSLDGNVYVLTYNGNQPTFIAQQLQYLLDHGVKIKNLYVDFYAYSAVAEPRIYDKKIFLDTDMKFKFDVWEKIKNSEGIGWVTFYEMFVTANNELIFTWPIHNKIVTAEYRNGGYLVPMEGRTDEELQALERNELGEINEIQVKGYRDIYEAAQKHDINLLFLETPKCEKIRAEKGEECYSKTLGEMKDIADEIGISYILSEDVGFDHEDSESFNDLIHLSSKGKKVYTEKLCTYLSSRSSF